MIRRFSIAHLLIACTLIAVLASVGRFAIGGAIWAQAILAVIGITLAWLVMHLGFVSAGYVVTLLARRLFPEKAQSPFATDTPAPQIIPPREIIKE